MSIKKPQVK